MADDQTTKPTIETVLEHIGALEGRMNERIDTLEERLGIRLDRIESVVNTTRGEMLELRADFREMRTQLREQFRALK